MAWNEPGAPGEKDPWGGRRKGASGAGFDQAWRDLQRKLSGFFGGGEPGSAKVNATGIGLIVVVLVVVWLLSGFYIVNQGERAVVLRFGQQDAITDAGLHWHLPFPIERVEKVNVEKVYPVEIGYRSNPKSGGKTRVPKEALMLTGDANIVDAEFAVQYKIKDPVDYLFSVRDPEKIIRQAAESAVREVVGMNTMDYVMTDGREAVDKDALDLLQQVLDRYHAGVEITGVEMQRAQPPEEVKTTFDDAAKAREEAQRLQNEAQAYSNDVIPRARGAAAQLVQEAEAYRESAVARAEGDARRFSAIANEYVKAPTVTRERLYIDTIEQVLSSTTKVLVDTKAGNNVVYLPLDKLMAAHEPATAAETPAAPAQAPAATESGSASLPRPDTRGRPDLRKREERLP